MIIKSKTEYKRPASKEAGFFVSDTWKVSDTSPKQNVSDALKASDITKKLWQHITTTTRSSTLMVSS